VPSQLRLRQPRLPDANVVRLLGLAGWTRPRAPVRCVLRSGRHEALIRSRACATTGSPTPTCR
jgi:hypothetical protein